MSVLLVSCLGIVVVASGCSSTVGGGLVTPTATFTPAQTATPTPTSASTPTPSLAPTSTPNPAVSFYWTSTECSWTTTTVSEEITDYSTTNNSQAPQEDTQIADGLSALLAGVTSSCSTGVGLTASLVTAAEVTFADVGGNDYQIPGMTYESWADYDSELQYMLIYANEPCISNAGGQGNYGEC